MDNFNLLRSGIEGQHLLHPPPPLYPFLPPTPTPRTHHFTVFTVFMRTDRPMPGPGC